MAGAHADEHFYENPLHLAIGSGSESVVDTLILAGADPNIVDNNGNTPLICAADLGHTSMIKTLLAAGADASHCAHDGRSALHAAAKSGEEEMVSALLNKGVDINVCDENGETPLVSAVKTGKNSAANSPVAAKALKAAKALLAAGAVVKTRGNDGCSALDWAATNGHADIVKAFLRYGAKANGCDVVDGRTALHRAAASTADTEDAIKALIDGGADINAYNEKGYTPLTDATRRFDCKSMLALLRNGADPNALGFHRNPALHEACMRRFAGLERVVDLLLRWGADDTAYSDDGLWPEEILDSGQAVYFGCSAEEIARTHRLLACAELDRIWRRRGWLIILRSRELEDASIHSGSGGDGSGDDDEDEQVDKTGRAARLRHRTGKSAADRREGGCGSDAREAAKGFSLMKMLPKIPEDLFRAVVSFL